MKTWIAAVFLALASSVTASEVMAQSWYEPQRGTQERRDLMDAIRPHAWWKLGAPVQFVVKDLRVSGDRAFAWLKPQRPGGGQIDPSQTPAAQRDPYFAEDMWDVELQAILWKSGNVWVVVDHTVGATEAWWSAPEFCQGWYNVIRDYCSN
ncbi:hypothetical protein [Thalassovita sp.]|uniref:hypothetical protein n=1 Tax=Thalassovita sp. TaxID=1979401 RepID=UPI002AAF5CC8|nr:hypothetical protein [Thalassovita sp.]